MTISAYLAPIAKLQFTDNFGNFLNGGRLFTYAAGTTTKVTTYADAAESNANSNPIILDSQGRCTVFLPPGIFFKFTLSPSTDTDPPTNALWTVDNIGVAANGVPYSVDSGTVNAMVATAIGVPSTPTVGASFLINPANGATGPATLNVNAWGAISIRDRNGLALTNGAFSAGQIMLLTYDGTFWRTQFSQQSPPPYAVDTGVVNAMIATVPTLPGSPAVGAAFLVQAAFTPTGPCTINTNAWGAIAMKNAAGNQLQTASFVANQIMLLAYDGTNWRTLF